MKLKAHRQWLARLDPEALRRKLHGRNVQLLAKHAYLEARWISQTVHQVIKCALDADVRINY